MAGINHGICNAWREICRDLLLVAARLWELSEQERRQVVELGYSEFGAIDLPGGLLIEIDTRTSTIAGIATTIAHKGRFPIEHSEVLNEPILLECPEILHWYNSNQKEFPLLCAYLMQFESMLYILRKISNSNFEKQ